MSFLHGVIWCFMARGMPQNNHFYNKKKKHFSNGKPELGVLFEQPPPPTHTHTHTHKHTDTHKNAHTLTIIVICARLKRSFSDYKINSVTPH